MNEIGQLTRDIRQRLQNPHELALMGESRLAGYTGHPPRLHDPRLASWVNEIGRLSNGAKHRDTRPNASPLAVNLVHPRGKLAGVLE